MASPPADTGTAAAAGRPARGAIGVFGIPRRHAGRIAGSAAAAGLVLAANLAATEADAAFVAAAAGAVLAYAGLVAGMVVAALRLTRILDARIPWRRIQRPEFLHRQVFEEMYLSLGTSFVFVALTGLVLLAAEAGLTRLYSGFWSRGPAYPLVSFFLLIFLFDTYFYWLHRLLHRPPFYDWLHRPHHVSMSPSPAAAFALHPSEAVVQFSFMLTIVFVLPLHISVLVAFSFVTAAHTILGHLNFELYPQSWASSPLFKWVTSSTHHNLHHRAFTRNYSFFFNFWDVWMGTSHPATEEEFERCTAPPIRRQA